MCADLLVVPLILVLVFGDFEICSIYSVVTDSLDLLFIHIWTFWMGATRLKGTFLV